MPKFDRMLRMMLLLFPLGSVQAQQAETPVAQAVPSVAQAVPSVEKLLPQLYAYVRKYAATLPSLSCDESITSQSLKNGKVRKEVKIEATLRVVRTESGPDPFSEKQHFNTIDGHPPPGNIPFFVSGGFANAPGFRKEELGNCFDYQVASQNGGKTLKLDMTLRSNHAEPACSEIPDGFRKTVLIDAASGRIASMERTISAEAAKRRKEVYFAAMEYGPQKMGDEILWLPTRMSAHDAKDEGRMFVTFSNYHRYTASSTIRPGDVVAVPD